jgi:hypothetical protein
VTTSLSFGHPVFKISFKNIYRWLGTNCVRTIKSRQTFLATKSHIYTYTWESITFERVFILDLCILKVILSPSNHMALRICAHSQNTNFHPHFWLQVFLSLSLWMPHKFLLLQYFPSLSFEWGFFKNPFMQGRCSSTFNYSYQINSNCPRYWE